MLPRAKLLFYQENEVCGLHSRHVPFGMAFRILPLCAYRLLLVPKQGVCFCCSTGCRCGFVSLEHKMPPAVLFPPRNRISGVPSPGKPSYWWKLHPVGTGRNRYLPLSSVAVSRSPGSFSRPYYLLSTCRWRVRVCGLRALVLSTRIVCLLSAYCPLGFMAARGLTSVL